MYVRPLEGRKDKKKTERERERERKRSLWKQREKKRERDTVRTVEITLKAVPLISEMKTNKTNGTSLLLPVLFSM